MGTPTPTIDAALAALEAPATPPPDERLEVLRGSLHAGERALFDRAVQLRRGYDDLNGRVLRSAAFAEASLGTAAFIHEMRQCLSPLIGLAELLKETPTSPFAGEWISEIAGQGRRVADLLDRHMALLKTSSAEQGPVDLSQVVAEAAQYFQRLPPGVSLSLDVAASLPRPVATRRRLLHALINLMANARDAQKGRPGVIQVSAQVREGRVELTVADQGSGVDPAVRGRLFEPLFTTKQEQGTGLGLYLSRELLRPHGELTLLEPGEGPPGAATAFRISLPLQVADGSSESAGQKLKEAVRSAGDMEDPSVRARHRAYDRLAPLVTELKNNPVLLVEDEPAVRRMTRAVLESVATLKIYEAADAAFALKLLEKVQIDFLICDKNLPDLDGLEVIRKAKAMHPGIDAMIVTGYPSPDSAAEAIRVGATDYLLKPVREVKTLRESVSSALSRQKLNRLCEKQEPLLLAICQDLLGAMPADGPARARLAALEQLLTGWTQGFDLTAAVLGLPDAAGPLRANGFSVGTLESASELAGLQGDVDLVLYPAGTAAEQARELLAAARGRTRAPHVLPVGRFSHTDAAVLAIQGRAHAVAETAAGLDGELLSQAARRRRREVRAEALGAVLKDLGFAV